MRWWLVFLLYSISAPASAQDWSYFDSARHASSGTVANATATATLPAIAGKTAKLAGLMVTGSGATAAATITCTVTGLNGGNWDFTYGVPSGVTTPAMPFIPDIIVPIPASGPGIAIAVTCPAAGLGNTRMTVSIIGYYK